VQVKDPYSGEVATHPYRVWLEPTLKARYETFLESSAYKKFKDENPKAGLSKTVFRQCICKCVRVASGRDTKAKEEDSDDDDDSSIVAPPWARIEYN
jgi:hypothetical protein